MEKKTYIEAYNHNFCEKLGCYPYGVWNSAYSLSVNKKYEEEKH
jgi:hypothetical protein